MTPSTNVAPLPGSPASSRGHRRVTSITTAAAASSGSAVQPSSPSGPAATHGALGLGVPPPGQGNVVNGLTPSFELTDNPLTSPPSRSAQLDSTGSGSGSSPKFNAHSRQRSQPAASTSSRQSHAPTLFASPPDLASHVVLPSASSKTTTPHAGPSQPKHMHVDVAAANQRYIRQRSDDDSPARRLHTPLHSSLSSHSSHSGLHHRPFSPQHAHNINLGSQDPLRRAWTPPARSPTRTSATTHAHAHGQPPRPMPLETPRRQGSIQRAAAAAQSMLENLGARASPTLFRSPGNKEAQSDRSSGSSDDDETEESSQDIDRYPHVVQRHSMTTSRSSRRTPKPRGALTPRSAKLALEDDEREPDGAGRRTPAKYRPSRGSGKVKSNSTDPSWYPPPLSYHRGTTPTGHHTSAAAGSSMSSHHSSIHIGGGGSSPVQGSSSPLVVPQARRGAINLKSSSKSRAKAKARSRRRARRRRSRPRRPFFQALFAFCANVIWHVAHPIHTVRVFKSYVVSLVRDVDHAFRDPIDGRRVWWPEWIGAYIPLLIWLGISITSTVTVLIFHKQVFKGLDQLSQTLQHLGFGGRMVLGSLIFITTFPPLPLYSTLIILCGFSFGLWQGFIISYIAALSGAVVVYLLSKSLLRGWMTNLLAKSGGLKKVVRAIEKRPKLLFLIRLAPYPYNLMNTLLASSPTLTFKTYFICTALALPKLLVHCGLGTSIKNFAAYNGAGAGKPSSSSPAEGEPGSPAAGAGAGKTAATHTAETVKHVAGFVGVALCIGIFIYLFSVARKAVDEEVGSDEEDEGEEEVDGAGAGYARGHGGDRGIEGEEYDALYLNSEEEEEDEELYTDEEGEAEGGADGAGFEARGGHLRSSSDSDSDAEEAEGHDEEAVLFAAPEAYHDDSAALHTIEVKDPPGPPASAGYWSSSAGPGAGGDDSLQHFRIASPDGDLEMEMAGVEKEFEGFAGRLK